MEMLGLTHFGGVYRGKRVLLTGHTGFKGSWLSLWLTELGANLTGISLSPETELNHWDPLGLSIDDRRIDVRDLIELQRVFDTTHPEVVFHLAAQPLVRRSYRDPIDTWSTNVMGTANVLEACRHQASVKAVVVVTTDKCYENQDWAWGYRESDRLGGHDPYSASKAAAEYVAASFRSSFFHLDSSLLLATARAGNVIGGGDWSEDRLIPDLIRAIEKKQSLEIRAPQATRPWQHVLESLSGYLLLGQKLLSGDQSYAEAWNFGPERDGNRSVSEVLAKLKAQWKTLCWHVTDQSQPHEANLLYLDSAKARSKLGWQPVWNLDITLEKTAEWYRAWLVDKAIISRRQLDDYLEAATDAGIGWAKP
jgi:CDP-glucose 4,6-dehydratase